MHAVHAGPDGASIRVDLQSGERLGAFGGPASVIVPADPENAEFRALLDAGVEIAPHAPPEPDRAAEAQAALRRSDVTLLRCYEAGLPVPEAWRRYRAALRALAGGQQGALPDMPPYPDADAAMLYP